MKRKTKQQNVKCPYCGRPAILRDAAYVYKENALDKHDLHAQTGELQLL